MLVSLCFGRSTGKLGVGETASFAVGSMRSFQRVDRRIDRGSSTTW